MSRTAELGEQVNALRTKLGLRPFTNPAKKGAALLEQELGDLQRMDLERNPPPPPPVEQPSATVTPIEPARARAAGRKAHRITETVDEEALMLREVPETIVAMSKRLLRHVFATDPTDGRTVGLMYGTIVSLILKKYPKATTSLECLRWYCVHMRAEDDRLPQKRPRPLTRAA